MSNYTHETVPTQFVEAKGIRYAYRRFGKAGTVQLLFLRPSDSLLRSENGGTIPPTDRYATLKNITHPTLIVHGNKDVVVPPINAFILAEHLPNAQLSSTPIRVTVLSIMQRYSWST